MPLYKVDSARSKIVVRSRSRVHDTSTTWDRVDGTANVDLNALENATATFSVDMTAFDAGDWLRNRKLKKDLNVARHPTATFEITGLREIERGEDSSFRAVADGVLRWRGNEVALSVTGSGAIDAQGIDASGSFDLDIRRLGVQPPRFLMFKVEDEVTIEVTLRALA